MAKLYVCCTRLAILRGGDTLTSGLLAIGLPDAAEAFPPEPLNGDNRGPAMSRKAENQGQLSSAMFRIFAQAGR